jgi:hypothetical protein
MQNVLMKLYNGPNLGMVEEGQMDRAVRKQNLEYVATSTILSKII